MPAIVRVLGIIVLLAWAPGVLAQSATETAIPEVIGRQLDGAWRINGCSLEKSDGA